MSELIAHTKAPEDPQEIIRVDQTEFALSLADLVVDEGNRVKSHLLDKLAGL